MNIIRDIFIYTFELFFPKDAKLLIYDTANCEIIEKTAVRTFADTPFQCIAPFPYKNTIIKNAIHTTKYHANKHTAKILAKALVPYISEELAELRMFENFHNPLLIPIPLHKIRINKRGFNQSERIADAIIEYMEDKNITLCTNALTRHKNTAIQTKSKNKKERYENMKNAFSIPYSDLILEKDILLLDDVITTGATLSSARNMLINNGARSVLCIAVAH